MTNQDPSKNNQVETPPAWPFEEARYNPFATPLRPDVATFLEKLTAPRHDRACSPQAEETLHRDLTRDSVHRISVYCFLGFLRGGVASWSTLLGNYVWVEEDDFGARCVIWAASDGFFVRGIPEASLEEVNALLCTKERTAWQIG